MENLTEVKVFSLFGKSGAMEEIKPISQLPMYCKIFCYGYAMNQDQRQTKHLLQL